MAIPTASTWPNFGFEAPVITTYVYDPTGASWTFTAQSGSNGSGISANRSGFTSSTPRAPQGGQVAFLQSAASITQTLGGFVAGTTYTITFSAAQRNRATQLGQTFDLRIDGTIIGSFAPPQSATNYVDYTATFTAIADTHRLAFVGTNLNGGDNTIFIDNVRISTAAPMFQTPDSRHLEYAKENSKTASSGPIRESPRFYI
jgi:hypothetical protein